MRLFDGAARFRQPDLAVAALAGLAAGVIYLRTLLPDLGGPEDTPKFQYLGYVLGTSHSPGYPLHTLISHLFSRLPIGTVAFRADLMSAVCGVLSVALIVLMARRLGVGRAAAAGGALMVAFGAAFWKYSVLAEVYTLAAVLLLAVVYSLIRWHQTSRLRCFYASAAFLALAVGNHLSIVAILPAALIFIVISPARQTLTPRRVVIAGAIAASGWLQYGFIWLRSVQGAEHLEARARTLRELFDVMRAKDFEHLVLGYTWADLWSTRMPALGEIVRDEIGLAGVALLLIGAIALARRHPQPAAFVMLSLAGLVVFLVNIGGDLAGFMVAPFALAGVLLAGGADALLRLISRWSRSPARVAAAAAIVALPAIGLVANFSANDWSHRTTDAAYFRAMVARMPPRFAIVDDRYETNHMVTYMTVAEGAGRTIDLVRNAEGDIRAVVDAGVPLYAFDVRQRELSRFGLDFEPVVVEGPRLGDALASLPRGWSVALAATGVALPPDVVQVLNLDRPRWRGQRSAPFLAVFATIGGADPMSDGNHELAFVEGDATRTAEAGGPERTTVVASADYDGPAVFLDETLLVTTDRGIAVAVFDDSGWLHQAYVVRAPEYRVPLTPAYLPLHRLHRTVPRALIGDRQWHDVTAFVEIRVNDQGEFAVVPLGLGGVPSTLLARATVDLVNPRRAAVFARPSRRLLRQSRVSWTGVSEYFDTFVGDGWHRTSRDANGAYRWTSATSARLMLPIAATGPVSLSMRVKTPPTDANTPAPLALSINGTPLTPCDIDSIWRTCEWTIPAGVLVDGGNEIELRTNALHPLPPPGPGHPAHYARGDGGAAVRWVQVRRH